MDFKERQKRFKGGKQNKPNQRQSKANNNNYAQFMTPVVFGIDDVLMNMFCSYVLSSNKNVHRYSITNMNKLVNEIDESNFANNQIMLIKFHFLKLALASRTAGLSGDLIISDISRKMDINGLVQDPYFLRELNNDEVKYVENTVGQFLNTLTFDSKIDRILKICNGYKQANYIQRDVLLGDFREVIKEAMTEFRRNDVNENSSSTRFRLSSINDSIQDIHDYITNPSYKLVTGMQGMNGLLGGGFQKTRVYCFFGMSGEGKTTTLVNILYQVWKYNKGFKTKDPTKKPCIILFTMENLVIEYICALFHIITRGKNIKDVSSAEAVLAEFKARKFEYSDGDDIELVIDFKPGRSKDTSYCYQLIEEMEDEGFECIGFFMDYLMRIKPVEYTGDNYADLGIVTDEFKTCAMLKDIPFITASQLNREAAKIIDEGRDKNQANIIKKLGRATIGDSIQIDRNLDGVIILVPEVSPTGERYMAYKLTKKRYEIYTNKLSIYQPFYEGSAIALVEDIFDTKPAFKESLARDPEEIRESFGDVDRVSINQTIKSLSSLSSASHEMIKQPGLVRGDEKQVSLSVDTLVETTKPQLLEVAIRVPVEEREKMRSLYFPDRKLG